MVVSTPHFSINLDSVLIMGVKRDALGKTLESIQVHGERVMLMEPLRGPRTSGAKAARSVVVSGIFLGTWT